MVGRRRFLFLFCARRVCRDCTTPGAASAGPDAGQHDPREPSGCSPNASRELLGSFGHDPNHGARVYALDRGPDPKMARRTSPSAVEAPAPLLLLLLRQLHRNYLWPCKERVCHAWYQVRLRIQLADGHLSPWGVCVCVCIFYACIVRVCLPGRVIVGSKVEYGAPGTDRMRFSEASGEAGACGEDDRGCSDRCFLTRETGNQGDSHSNSGRLAAPNGAFSR